MINGKRYLTINTDASWSPRTKCAGYAWWIVWDHPTEEQPRRLHSSASGEHHCNSGMNEAEVKAIALALDFCREKQLLEGIHQIVVNTDSLFAIAVLQKRLINTNPAIDHLDRAVFNTHCNIRAKHVKAHTNDPAARSYVNRWCDEHAKKARKELERRKHAESVDRANKEKVLS